MRTLHFVVPEGIDDPARPSGGNVYDRHVGRDLAALGWSVREHAVPGQWPRPGDPSLAALSGALARIPDGAVVLLDGLVACAAPEVLVPHSARLRVVVLVHMPLGHRPARRAVQDVRRRERAVLSAAVAVVATSAWSRRRLLELYRLPADRVHVAPPGVDAAELVRGTAAGGALVCVAAVTFDKGHDMLLDALLTIADLSWDCVCVGSLDRDPAFARRLRSRIFEHGLSERVSLPGPRAGSDLDRTYASADLLVLASRAETYGMVVTEALARGLPVVAPGVGGLPEALGHGAAGVLPGLLVGAGDPAQLGAALRAWLTDAALRARLRQAARERRASLSGWASTAATIAGALNVAPG